jgi:hypothetical protein
VGKREQKGVKKRPQVGKSPQNKLNQVQNGGGGWAFLTHFCPERVILVENIIFSILIFALGRTIA